MLLFLLQFHISKADYPIADLPSGLHILEYHLLIRYPQNSQYYLNFCFFYVKLFIFTFLNLDKDLLDLWIKNNFKLVFIKNLNLLNWEFVIRIHSFPDFVQWVNFDYLNFHLHQIWILAQIIVSLITSDLLFLFIFRILYYLV